MRRPRPIAIATLVALLMMLATSAALANTEGLSVRGEGSMRWFGLKIYDAKLYTPESVTSQKLFASSFALELTYAREFMGNKIAQRSLEEIQKLRIGSPEQHQEWLNEMRRLFPNVKAGDRLRGVYHPTQGADFFFNGKPLGRIQNTEFSRAFFSIWLDPKTAEPGLRNALLGATSATPAE